MHPGRVRSVSRLLMCDQCPLRSHTCSGLWLLGASPSSLSTHIILGYDTYICRFFLYLCELISVDVTLEIKDVWRLHFFMVTRGQVDFYWQSINEVGTVGTLILGKNSIEMFKKTFSRTHRLDKNDNIGITGFTVWKQKKSQQQNVTPLSIELTTSAIQV